MSFGAQRNSINFFQLNNSMEKELNSKTGKPKISSRGGARPGAGRKPGSKDNITVKHLLEALDARTGGQSYEELLVEDFITARLNNDTSLMLKYHNLIMNKVMSTLHKVETIESEDQVEARAQAFSDALIALTKVNQK